MKYWGVTLFVLLVCTSAWGQANQFRFISALHAAKASFDTIETKNTKEPTVFKGGTAINVGSSASSTGTIDIQGFPIQIDTLTMDDGTQLSDSDSSSNKWLVDTLQIGDNGNVVVGTLIANQVSLNKENEVTVTVDETLLIKGSAWTQTGSASDILNARGKGNEGSFIFEDGGKTKDEDIEATWSQLNRTQTETGKTIGDPGTYYPIRS